MPQETFELGSLTNCNLKQANQMLKDGRATKKEGEEFVRMWNSPGKRFTHATLEEHETYNDYLTERYTFYRIEIRKPLGEE